MIYGYLTEWMVNENPSFACAVARHYSIEHGQRKAAAQGELAYLQAAQKVVNRGQPLSPAMLLCFLSARERASTTDEKYLARLLDAVRLSRKAKPADDKESPPMIEHIFEAYYFLRKRDGKGSPLPIKAEVKNTAALIAAFCMEGLTAKLPEYLWRDGRGLTEEQFQRIERVRKCLIEDKDPDTEKPRDHNWPERLAAAGLSDLPQKRRGKK